MSSIRKITYYSSLIVAKLGASVNHVIEFQQFLEPPLLIRQNIQNGTTFPQSTSRKFIIPRKIVKFLENFGENFT